MDLALLAWKPWREVEAHELERRTIRLPGYASYSQALHLRKVILRPLFLGGILSLEADSFEAELLRREVT